MTFCPFHHSHLVSGTWSLRGHQHWMEVLLKYLNRSNATFPNRAFPHRAFSHRAFQHSLFPYRVVAKSWLHFNEYSTNDLLFLYRAAAAERSCRGGNPDSRAKHEVRRCVHSVIHHATLLYQTNACCRFLGKSGLKIAIVIIPVSRCVYILLHKRMLLGNMYRICLESNLFSRLALFSPP